MGTTLRRAKPDTLAWGFHNYRQPVKRLAGLFVGYALRGIHIGALIHRLTSQSIPALFHLRPRMRRVVRLGEVLKVQARIDLGGADVGVA